MYFLLYSSLSQSFSSLCTSSCVVESFHDEYIIYQTLNDHTILDDFHFILSLLMINSCLISFSYINDISVLPVPTIWTNSSIPSNWFLFFYPHLHKQLFHIKTLKVETSTQIFSITISFSTPSVFLPCETLNFNYSPIIHSKLHSQISKLPQDFQF